jgi:hypothetical protein
MQQDLGPLRKDRLQSANSLNSQCVDIVRYADDDGALAVEHSSRRAAATRGENE